MHSEVNPPKTPPSLPPVRPSSRMSQNMSSSDPIVKLNIGGYKFCTTKETLASQGENFFTALISGRIPSVCDKDGYYFIDRDGQYFHPILEYLRTSELIIPDHIPQHCLYREANFFSIDLPPSDLNLVPRPVSSIQVRSDGVYFGKDFNVSYCFGTDGKGTYNMFNNFPMEFTYIITDALVFVYFEATQVTNQKMKKVLLYNQGVLIDANYQNESLDFYPCNQVNESALYQGTLDISKEGKSRNLSALVFTTAKDTVYLNISAQEEPNLVGSQRAWKKGIYKVTKFLCLSSLVISIPLDSNAIEVITFGTFLLARVRRETVVARSGGYFSFFVDRNAIEVDLPPKNLSLLNMGTPASRESDDRPESALSVGKKSKDRDSANIKKLLPLARGLRRSNTRENLIG